MQNQLNTFLAVVLTATLAASGTLGAALAALTF